MVIRVVQKEIKLLELTCNPGNLMQYDETKHHVKFQLHRSRHPGVNRKNNLKIMENCVKTALKPVNQLHESRTRLKQIPKIQIL